MYYDSTPKIRIALLVMSEAGNDSPTVLSWEVLIPETFEQNLAADVVPADTPPGRISDWDVAYDDVNNGYLFDAYKGELNLDPGLHVIIYDTWAARCGSPMDPEEWDSEHEIVYDQLVMKFPVANWWVPTLPPLVSALDAAEDRPCQAQLEWQELQKNGQLRNEEVYKGFLGVLTLEKRYPDQSILRWNDTESRWHFYRNRDELAWSQKTGDA